MSLRQEAFVAEGPPGSLVRATRPLPSSPSSSSAYCVAVPIGVREGERFTVPDGLGPARLRSTLTRGTARGTEAAALALCRGFVLQEVEGVFERPMPRATLPVRCMRCAAGTACCFPCCFMLGCSDHAGAREFLVRDGDATDDGAWLYLLKEQSSRAATPGVLCCGACVPGGGRARCAPNHSIIIQAYRVIHEKERIGGDPDDGDDNGSNPQETPVVRTMTHDSAVGTAAEATTATTNTTIWRHTLRPDLQRGPMFAIARRGSGVCLSFCNLGWDACAQHFVVTDGGYDHHSFLRAKSKNNRSSAGAAGVGKINDGGSGIIGRAYQTKCGGGSCCVPTLNVMRRDSIATADGISETENVFAFLEGPWCCAGGCCCEKRNRKHWYMSAAKGKAYDIATIQDTTWRMPEGLAHLRRRGMPPRFVSFRKRGGMTPAEKKLTIATVVGAQYAFVRRGGSVGLCQCHCCGANNVC